MRILSIIFGVVAALGLHLGSEANAARTKSFWIEAPLPQSKSGDKTWLHRERIQRDSIKPEIAHFVLAASLSVEPPNIDPDDMTLTIPGTINCGNGVFLIYNSATGRIRRKQRLTAESPFLSYICERAIANPIVLEWRRDPMRGCGSAEMWKKYQRVAYLPGCDGDLPPSATAGDFAIHNAKANLKSAEQVLGTKPLSLTKFERYIDEARQLIDDAPGDNRTQAAERHYRDAITVLQQRKNELTSTPSTDATLEN